MTPSLVSTFGIVCSVRCHYGYILSEDVKWTCQDNGRWSSYKTVQCTGRYMWYTYIHEIILSLQSNETAQLSCSHYFGQTTSGAHYQAPILGVSTYNTCTSVFCRYMYQKFPNFKVFISLNKCRSSARKVLHQMIQSVMSLIINITTYTFMSSSCIKRCKTQVIQQANQYVFGLWDKYIKIQHISTIMTLLSLTACNM